MSPSAHQNIHLITSNAFKGPTWSTFSFSWSDLAQTLGVEGLVLECSFMSCSSCVVMETEACVQPSLTRESVILIPASRLPTASVFCFPSLILPHHSHSPVGQDKGPRTILPWKPSWSHGKGCPEQGQNLITTTGSSRGDGFQLGVGHIAEG